MQKHFACRSGKHLRRQDLSLESTTSAGRMLGVRTPIRGFTTVTCLVRSCATRTMAFAEVRQRIIDVELRATKLRWSWMVAECTKQCKSRRLCVCSSARELARSMDGSDCLNFSIWSSSASSEFS